MKQEGGSPYIVASRVFVIALSMVLITVLNGCAFPKGRFGQKFDLSKIPVSSIQANLPQGSGISPGEKSPLVVTLIEPDGKILYTQGAGRGTVRWKDLKVEASVVRVNQKGIVSLPRDPRLSDGKTGHIRVTVPIYPELHAELDIVPRYDRVYEADFSGRNGMDGLNGMDGSDGMSGSTGSFDPNNPSSGGDGTDGSDGSDGKDGDRGGDGASVQIRVTLRSVHTPLLAIGVYANGDEEFYLIDPKKGSLTVTSDGGRGGTGGKGGRGGRGGRGGFGGPGMLSGRDGRDGLSGRNGFDGQAGSGGQITVIYDPQTEPYLGVIHLFSHVGPVPIFQEQTVAPLW